MNVLLWVVRPCTVRRSVCRGLQNFFATFFFESHFPTFEALHLQIYHVQISCLFIFLTLNPFKVLTIYFFLYCVIIQILMLSIQHAVSAISCLLDSQLVIPHVLRMILSFHFSIFFQYSDDGVRRFFLATHILVEIFQTVRLDSTFVMSRYCLFCYQTLIRLFSCCHPHFSSLLC